MYLGNNSKAEVKGIGTCKLVMRGGRILLLHDVLYAPEIRRNLISVNVLLSLGYVLIFKDNGLDIFLNSVLVGTGYMLDGFIVLNTNVDSCVNESCFSYVTSASNANTNVNMWHSRLGHIGQDRMKLLAREGILSPLAKIDLPICKDENIGIDGNIEGQKYGNIGGNIGEISISIKP